jgi:hypothetical protein
LGEGVLIPGISPILMQYTRGVYHKWGMNDECW